MSIVDTVRNAIGMGTKSDTGAAGEAGTSAPPEGLDKFAFLGDTGTTESKQDSDSPNSVSWDRASKVLTPEAAQALAAKQDFTSAISSDTLTALREGKVEALLSAMNDIGRQSYALAMQHSGQMADNVLDSRMTGLSNKLPTDIASMMTQQELKSEIPGFNHPVVREMLKDTSAKIRAAHPDATAKEIAAQTKEYFTEIAKLINPDANFDGKTKEATMPSVDWFEYASTNAN